MAKRNTVERGEDQTGRNGSWSNVQLIDRKSGGKATFDLSFPLNQTGFETPHAFFTTSPASTSLDAPYSFIHSMRKIHQIRAKKEKSPN